MARSNLRRKMLALKLAIFGAPLVTLLVVLRFVLPGLKDHYDLARFGSAEDTVRIELSHFHLYTKHGQTYAAELANGLETFYRAFLAGHGEEFQLLVGDEKAIVYVFANKVELEKWSQREFHDPMANNGGFYSPGKREIGIIAVGRDLAEDLQAGYHESVHMAFDIGLGPSQQLRLSSWLSEGLAEYFGDAVVRRPEGYVWGEVPASQVGGLVRVVRRHVEAEASPLLPRIIGASPREFTSEGNDLYYAASYLLVHFLLDGEDGALRTRFLEFYELERKSGSQSDRPAAFFRGLGVEPTELERRWRRHVQDVEMGLTGG